MSDGNKREVKKMSMKKMSVGQMVLVIVIYLLMFILGSTSGLLGPAVYAYVGTVMPVLFAFVYLYTSAKIQNFGAAAILNGATLIIAFIVGEGNLALAIGLILFAALAEIIRKANGYDTLKGVRRSFIPFAFSFYAYSAHWWTETEASLQAAIEEMPSGYADKMAPVIANIPMLVVMLILVIPFAILGMCIAEKVLKKHVVALN